MRSVCLLALLCAVAGATTAVCPTSSPAAGSCTVGVAAPTSSAASSVIAANSGSSGGSLSLTSPPSAVSVSAGNVCYRLGKHHAALSRIRATRATHTPLISTAVPCISAAATFSSATGLDGTTCPPSGTIYLSSYVPYTACATLLSAYPADLSVCTTSTSDCNAVPSSAAHSAMGAAHGLAYRFAVAFAAVL
jgi:hypothetical protein